MIQSMATGPDAEHSPNWGIERTVVVKVTLDRAGPLQLSCARLGAFLRGLFTIAGCPRRRARSTLGPRLCFESL